ncbi:MAG: outer membrane beta-barrel protein [Balneolaceae bacterium]|nr:outer membrane beta-barrel protein [Balneolaceae bacterium]
MKKLLTVFSLVLIFVSVQETASAQFSVAAAYEIRDEVPENGFGFRVERGILNDLPLLDLGLRLHFSYFNESNNVSLQGVTVSRDIDVYDYGFAALAGFKLGLVKPYIGLGIGNQNYNFDVEPDQFSFDESSFYWNGFGGAEITLLPVLSPFIEYRISRLTGTDDIEFDSINRLTLGLKLNF